MRELHFGAQRHVPEVRYVWGHDGVFVIGSYRPLLLRKIGLRGPSAIEKIGAMKVAPIWIFGARGIQWLVEPNNELRAGQN